MTNRQVTVSDILYDGSFRLSPKKRQKYYKYFKLTKKKYEDFLTGAEVAVIVKDKGLSMKDLFQVWNFADGDEDGCLSVDEFCLAMAMIDILKERREMRGFTVLKKSGLRVTIKKESIEKNKSDIIVCTFGNAVNFAGGYLPACIYLAGGIELQKSFDRKYPTGIKDGQIVALPAEGELKCNHVIVGRIPVYEDSSNLDEVHKFILGCLHVADDYGAKSIAFPLFGTGGLQYNKADIAKALFEVLENFPNRSSLRDVFLVAHPLDRASLFALREAEQRHLYSYGVKDNQRSKAAESIPWNGRYTSTISCLDFQSVERRKEHEMKFAEYAVKNHADASNSITGKHLTSILLQTGVDIYTVHQIMTIINKSDKSQVHVEDFLKASALLDQTREGYLLPDISQLYKLRDEMFNNIQYRQHIFDPRYCLSWFYHRDMKFEKADEILKKPGRRDGSFLVWRRKKNDFYTLGTIYGCKTFHLRIDITATTYSVEKNVKFPKLGHLIQYYMFHPLPLPGDRRLKYPIPVHTPSTKRWFYPNISPVSAILLLRLFSTEHNFIIRYSVETPGCFAFVVRSFMETISFKIIHKHGFYCLRGGEDTAERFLSLDAMIEYYHKNPFYCNSWRDPIYCKSFTLKRSTSPPVPVCAQHPKAPLVVGETEYELLCMACSEKVDGYFIVKEKLEEFRETFSRLDSENFSTGLLTESNVKSFLRDKGVLEDDVSRIWQVADLDQDKFLDKDEFCIAMYLAELALAKKMLPQRHCFPPSLIPPFGANEEKNLPEEILQMDQHSIQLYRECLEDKEEADYHIRVIVIGQTRVGKTTLTRNLLRLPEIRPPGTTSTDGVDIHKSFVSLSDNTWITDKTEKQKASRSHDAKLIKLFRSTTSLKNEVSTTSWEAETEIEDDDKLAGDEVSDNTLKPTEVPSESNPISFTLDDVENNMDASQIASEVEQDAVLSCNEFLQMVHTFEKVKLGPSDTAIDQSQTASDAFLNTVRNLVMFQQDSVADFDNTNYGELSVWDFAGQFVFYTTHHTFLTPRAVYLLVTRLDQSINDPVDNDQCVLDVTGCKELKIRDLVLYWMNSVHLYSHGVEHQPPVVLVGTHLDKIKGDKEKKTKEYFVELRKSLLKTPTSRHLIDKDFTISNTPTELEIESLQQKIVELASMQKYWGEKIPARWIALERAMVEQKLEGKCVLSYKEVVELDKSTGVPIGEKEKLDLFLRYQHAIGNIIYFSEGCLREHIVLSPQWLIDAFKCIITARQFCIENPALAQYWDDLNSTGKLHQSMVEGIFRKQDRFCLHKEHILGLMERLDIISRPFVHQPGDKSHPALQEFYFVPSLLQNKLTECQLDNYVRDTNRTPFLCFVFRNNFLPPAVFHRLLAACVSKYPVAKQGSQLLMFCGCGMFDLNGGLTRLVVAFYDSMIQIGLFQFSQKKYPPESATCVSVQMFVAETLKRILGRYCMNLPFSLKVKCESSPLLSNDGLLSVGDLTTEGEDMVCHGHDNKSHIIVKQRHLQGWFPDKVTTTDNTLENKGDQLTSVTFGHLDAIPDDLELSRISAKIGKEFETLAHYLGIADAEIFQIRSDHPLETRSQIYHILVRWKQKSGKNATYRCLEEAFRMSEINVEILFGL